MWLALVVVVGSAGIALLLGGSWNALTNLPVKGRRLVVIAIAAQVLGGSLARLTAAHGFYPAGLTVSALAALGFCWRNRRIAGVPLVTLGLLSNALVVILNGSMPVSISAAVRADVSIAHIAAGADPRHEVAGPHTTLRILCDNIPVLLPRRPEVDSPGDVLIAAGLGELVLLGMRPRRPRRRAGNAASDTSTPTPAAAVTLGASVQGTAWR